MALIGYEKAVRRLETVAGRCLNPREALEAIGREARSAHTRYFRGAASQGSMGGGPPGAPWPALEPETIKRKLKKGHSRKLVEKGSLRQGYVFRATRESMKLWNEARHAIFLQSGVGKMKKKFTVVATNLKTQDPGLLEKIKFMACRWLRTGRTS